MPQPKLIFDNNHHTVGGLPFTMPFTMPGDRSINRDSQVKRLILENRSAKLIFADDSKKLIFDITIEVDFLLVAIGDNLLIAIGDKLKI